MFSVVMCMRNKKKLKLTVGIPPNSKDTVLLSTSCILGKDHISFYTGNNNILRTSLMATIYIIWNIRYTIDWGARSLDIAFFLLYHKSLLNWVCYLPLLWLFAIVNWPMTSSSSLWSQMSLRDPWRGEEMKGFFHRTKNGIGRPPFPIYTAQISFCRRDDQIPKRFWICIPTLNIWIDFTRQNGSTSFRELSP